MEGGDFITAYDIAKEITVAAIENKLITQSEYEENNSSINRNQQLAENVAAFYNTLVDKIK